MSKDCQSVPVHAITDKRGKAVQFALTHTQHAYPPELKTSENKVN
jgi:hypothetical protein